MRRYVIERTVHGAGQQSAEELAAFVRATTEALGGLDGRARWLHTYVTADKLFCFYLADDPEVLREHGVRGDLPVDTIHEVGAVLEPQAATP